MTFLFLRKSDATKSVTRIAWFVFLSVEFVPVYFITQCLHKLIDSEVRQITVLLCVTLLTVMSQTQIIYSLSFKGGCPDYY